MEYNIGFVIGDPSGDGHACTTEYHIVANHSVDEISEAYKKTTELLGFDFVKEVGVEFQSDPWIPEKFTKKLLELEIIDKEYVIESDSEYGTPAGCYEFECAEDEFVDIYFAIAKYFLPDLNHCFLLNMMQEWITMTMLLYPIGRLNLRQHFRKLNSKHLISNGTL